VTLLRRLGQARRNLTWRHWAWATAISVLTSLYIPFQDFDVNWYWAVQRLVFHTPWLIAFGYFFLVAIALVETGARAADPPMARYAFAALAVGLGCIATTWTLAPIVQAPPYRVVEGKRVALSPAINRESALRASAAVTLGLNAAFHGILATLIYARLRHSRRAARALADAELARSEATHSLLASRLRATQAEVDPAYVIDRLEWIGRAYETDPQAADAQLEELIGFLRDAIPRIRRDEIAMAAA
jgi:hypothetical protein